MFHFLALFSLSFLRNFYIVTIEIVSNDRTYFDVFIIEQEISKFHLNDLNIIVTIKLFVLKLLNDIANCKNEYLFSGLNKKKINGKNKKVFHRVSIKKETNSFLLISILRLSY